jgi:serine/threonine protein kinase
MMKIQKEQNDEMIDGNKSTNSGGSLIESRRQQMSKSISLTPRDMGKLLDDGDQGIGYNSFQLIEILG